MSAADISSLFRNVDAHALQKGLAALERLPEAARAVLAPPQEVDGQTLDWRWSFILRANGLLLPKMEALPVPQARALFRREMAALAGPPTAAPGIRTLDTTVPGAVGPLSARWYLPDGAPTDRMVLYWHGGGFVVGDLETHRATCTRIASQGLRVLAATYRLAPEHPFPAAFDDTIATVRHLLSEGERVIVAGDSAGGNLSASVASALARAGEPGPAGHLLFYPALDLPGRYRSDDLFEHGFGLERGLIDWFMSHLFAGCPAALQADPRCSPLLHEVPRLAPTWLSVAGFDPLRDQSLRWADALRHAGSTVELNVYSEHIHGYVNAVDVIPAAGHAVDAAARWAAELDLES